MCDLELELEASAMEWKLLLLNVNEWSSPVNNKKTIFWEPTITLISMQ